MNDETTKSGFTPTPGMPATPAPAVRKAPGTPEPAPEPMPQTGGSYRRNADGSLTQVEGPHPDAPIADASTPTAKE